MQILYGAPGGLEAAGNRVWSQASPGIEGTPEEGDRFGTSLACSDVDADGFADLAIGVPNESVGELGFAGAVNVIYGTASGLSATRDQIFTQDTEGIGGVAQAGDLFGFSLAFGDFNNDLYPDLALGVPGQTLGEFANAGEAIVLMGTAAGLTADGDLRLRQGPAFAGDVAEADDSFGSALAAADFNNDGFDDLAIGAGGEDIEEGGQAGAVNVVFGSAAGLTPAGAEFWHQDLPGFPGTPETNDNFGRSLAACDFDNDGFDDLAVGVQGEDLGAVTDAGVVQVLPGGSGGLMTATQTWSQDSAGIDDEAQAGDEFGTVLTTGDFNRDGFGDLAIAAPLEDAASVENTGLVHVIYGGPPGTRPANLSRQRRALGGVLNRLQRQLDELP